MNIRSLALAIVASTAAIAASPAAAHWSLFPHTHTTTPVETVPYTGTTHLVEIVKDGFFPFQTFTNEGDRILFVNMASTTEGVKGTNNEWNSGNLGYKEGYLVLVQPGIQRNFKNLSWNARTGNFTTQALPKELSDGSEVVPPIETVLGLVNVSVSVLDNLLDDLGLDKLVGGLLGN